YRLLSRGHFLRLHFPCNWTASNSVVIRGTVILNAHDETAHRIWSVCSNRDARLLCLREAEFLVHFGLCPFVRAWFDLRSSSRRLALRTSRSSVDSRSGATVVGRSAAKGQLKSWSPRSNPFRAGH